MYLKHYTELWSYKSTVDGKALNTVPSLSAAVVQISHTDRPKNIESTVGGADDDPWELRMPV